MTARFETMEERIGSLEREVKLSNLKLSRIEEKLDELLSMLIEQKVAARQPDAERHSANEDTQVQEQVPQPSSKETNAIEETEKDKDDEQEHHEHEAVPEIPVLPVRTVHAFLTLDRNCARNEAFLQQMAEELQQNVVASQKRARNVRRVMETLVTYDVLCQFTWSGRKATTNSSSPSLFPKYSFEDQSGIIALLVKALSYGLNAEQTKQEKSSIVKSVCNAVKHSSQNKKRFCQKRKE
ncbi:uncharacterized protein LOC120902818 isoform X2 [Anopheles arabiensis]|uniref:DUF4806 domain-containing protein n=1 Tax=Anopheles arabiensis TaxID=7173 RepID=A0A8W7MT83_ANOAR|nr:uncharacterized protein LOC120902818 isoform X2 [Anopheles arabiensis]XP_040167783.1 uncharacterized protein LOC120902818 isoform X2 [Anopheles arabiensis]XP_040167784.1 uncharacterized protein LOC120902818 isoform X2 [Anopheles arabiensis]XP_040167785.1 uncharacterized protein LOC120902818 isoform X2 [Anopheles arabiensis]